MQPNSTATSLSPLAPEAPPCILVVDDEVVILDILKDVLEYEGFRVTTASSGEAAMQTLAREPFDVVLTDLKMPGVDGLELLRRVQDGGFELKTIMMTGFGTVETAVDAMKRGAFDYIMKPFKPDEVVRLLRRACEKQRLERENLALREQLGAFELSEALSSAMPLDDQLALIVKMVQENLGAEGVSLCTEDPKRAGIFTTRVRTGEEDFHPKVERLVEHFLTGEKVLAHEEGVAEWMARPATAEHVVHSFMSAPLRVRGRPVGVISAYSTRAGHRFTEGQRKGLHVFGGRAATAIENARMYGDLRKSFTETIEGLARALEAKDPYTAGHSDRVAMYAKVIARALQLPESEVERVYHGGLLHDIGKIGINLDVLNKAQKLTEAEYELFKSHTVKGRRIIEPITFLNNLIPYVYSHHEAWNGRGYPEGVGSTDISFEGRLMAVADSYDAMTSNRPYRKALPHDIAIAELQRCAGKQFDVQVVQAFVGVIEDFRKRRRDQGLPVPE